MTGTGQLEAIFPGASEMARRMRAHQWSTTPLGAAAAWPETLKTALRIMLTSRYAMWMGWGPELTFFYNDAYGKMTLGPKHPWALGRSVREVWAEIWGDVGPRAESVMRTGEATWDEALLLFLERLGFSEETYHTFSYSPLLDDSGAVGGMLCVVTEDTERIIGERRLRILRELAAATVDAKSAAEACQLGAQTLGNYQQDVPFALLYLLDGDGTHVRLAAGAGLAPGSAPAPECVGLDQPAGGRSWPFRDVLTSRALTTVDLHERFGAVHAGPWPEAIRTALVTPLGPPEQVTGFFVAGASVRRPFDDGYRDFLTLVSSQLSSALTSAEAFEAERRRAETLAELDRAKTAFFSNVSHEFRTPLTLMLGPLEDALADHDETLPSAQRERLDVAHRNSLRLLKLVNTLLDFSRIEAGRVEAVYEETDLCAFTRELASLFRAATERAGLSLEVAGEPISGAVYVDREMWEKVVLNLLSNAFKFTLQGGIFVTLAERGNAVAVSVRDTGSGIPRQELAHVFERFHRVKGAQGRTHEGTGIGLALVQELVKLHGGTVSVESELGTGTTFTISIPTGRVHLPPERVNAARTIASTGLGAAPYVEEALRWLPDVDAVPAAEARSWSRAGVPSAGARVLVADDNKDMREYLCRLLSAHWQVEAVEDGDAALAAVRRCRPELVLTDVMMPKRDGFGVLKALRGAPETRTLPVILLSARAGEEARVEGLDAGADDYLIKPFGARELVARVNTHLEMARVRREQADERERLLAIAERARSDAEDANRAKDEFLAVLSHELRSPMNAMLGWLRILRTGGSRDPELLGRAVDTIERNIWVQAQVINDLLDVSRILSGKLQLDATRLELSGLVHACVESLRPSAEGKQIALRLTLPGHDLEVIGDAARLQQVVSNLVVNAVKFTDPGGVITVAVEHDHDHDLAVLRVEDTGQGIAPEFLPHLFERFRQADSSSARRHGGLGLGLSIVKNLVALHGGEVEAASAGVGRGARFAVRLPLAEARERAPFLAPARRADAGTEALPTLDVLLVEDDPDSREALELLLAESGARVRSAASVRQALEEYRVRAPDVMISDIGMPGEDGYVLIRAVREIEEGRSHRTLAIAMTGFASRQDHEMALRAGFDEHIAKPVEPEALLDRMRVLSAARASREAPPRRL